MAARSETTTISSLAIKANRHCVYIRVSDRTRSGSFSLSSSSCCTAGSMSRRVESCSEPGTTRTSKIRPAGRSPNVICVPSENSKTSRFGRFNILKTAFAGPRAVEAHLGIAGCQIGFLILPRRRGYLRDHRRILRSYFTMTSIIASMAKQKPRNSSCVSIVVSIKNRQLLALMAQEAPTDGDRRCRTPVGCCD